LRMAAPLAYYYEILEGESRARYLIAKSSKLGISLDSPTDLLNEEHSHAVEHADIPRDPRGTSLLDLKFEIARRMLENCRICERACGADRSRGEKGHCGVLEPRISSTFLHMGEEPDLVPSYTIFFSGCTFNCVYCQNWDISTRPGSGDIIEADTLARMIEAKEGHSGSRLGMQYKARNVNWVGGDPTSNLPFILDVLRRCSANLPQVWNSNMYLSQDAMKLLDGVVDVYLTDFKYGNDECARRLSNAPDYLRVVKRNHLLGRAHAEMIIRHLVLPGHLKCCTEPVLSWIAENLEDVRVNVMAQYRPEFRAREFPELSKPLKMPEFQAAIDIAERLGLDLCD